MSLKLLSSSKCFGGLQQVYSHASQLLSCEMKFGVFLPPVAVDERAECPVLYYLSGRGCNHENFLDKSGMQHPAANSCIIVVNPDTSPRVTIPDQEKNTDLGPGACFYVDATEQPWARYYKMYTYITKELVEVVNKNLPVIANKKSISGYSMGGHGALICALKNPNIYQSVSALMPIANPSKAIWGQKVLTAYLGKNSDAWKEWDATRLVETYTGPSLDLFIDQGDADKLLKEELLVDNFLKAAKANHRVKVIYKLREGYDHSSFYYKTFVPEHIEYHSKLLKRG